jgi:hypothetical protein
MDYYSTLKLTEARHDDLMRAAQRHRIVADSRADRRAWHLLDVATRAWSALRHASLRRGHTAVARPSVAAGS